MHGNYDTPAPCVCCDRIVLMRSIDWTPVTAAVCLRCLNSTPFYVIRALFILRTQMAHLAASVAATTQAGTNTERRMDRIVAAQQELEEKVAGT